jgi:DNA-binding transcriptional regulator/RsmH inhibitor MraZ
VGRICLPEKLANKAQLGKKAILVGLFDRFQIWNPEHYRDTNVSDEVVRPDAIKLI